MMIAGAIFLSIFTPWFIYPFVDDFSHFFMTNPPWSREILHPIIENLRSQAPTWLLFDSDWMFTAQSNPYMKYCEVVLPVGRLKWIPGSKHTGKDNCAWYLFVDHKTPCTFMPKLDRK